MKKPICMECEHFIHKQKLKGYDGYCEVLKQFTVLSMGCSEFSEGRNKIYKKAPTVDAVEVVRCKDCKYCDRHHLVDGLFCYRLYEKYKKEYPQMIIEIDADDFCSRGEKR